MKQYKVVWIENAKIRQYSTNNQNKALMLAEYLDLMCVWCRFYDNDQII